MQWHFLRSVGTVRLHAKRLHKMKDADRLQANECIASGHIESAVKCTVTVRLKRPGATWSHQGGEATVHVRSLLLSGLWVVAWKIHIDRQFRDALNLAA